jgi:hypothetical protein
VWVQLLALLDLNNMTQKQEFNRLRKENEKVDNITKLTKKKYVSSKFSNDKTKQLAIDYVLDENNNPKRELIVLTNTERIVLDTIGIGNLSFLDSASYLMDAVITSTGDRSIDFIAMLYFNVGNLVVYKGKPFTDIDSTGFTFKDIEGTDLNFITNEPYTTSNERIWGRFVYLNHNFFILSPFPINNDNVYPLLYFSDRDTPFGFRDIGASIGINQYYASFDGNDANGSINPIPPEDQPVLLAKELNNIGNKLHLYQQLDDDGPSSGFINATKYNHFLVTQVSGTKVYTKTILHHTTLTTQCENLDYDDLVSLKYTINVNINFNTLYGDYESIKGNTTNNFYINALSPEMMFIQTPDSFFVFSGTCVSFRRHKFWVYDGVKTFGNYEYGFNFNVPQNEFGNSISSKFITKNTKSIQAIFKLYAFGLDYIEVAPNRPSQHANNYGLELARNITDFNPTCFPEIFTSLVNEETTIVKQYVYLDNPLPVDNIGSNNKYQYYTSYPFTSKTIKGNLAFGSDCTIANADQLPAYSQSNYTEIFASYNQSGISETGIYPNKKITNKQYFNLNSTNCGFNINEPITIDSINNYQFLYNSNLINKNSELTLIENQVEDIEDIEKVTSDNAFRQYGNKPSNIFYNSTNSSIILSISTEL